SVAAIRDALLVSDCKSGSRQQSCSLSARSLVDGSLLWEQTLPGDANVALPAGAAAQSAMARLVSPMTAAAVGFVLAETSIDIDTPRPQREWQAIDVRDGNVIGVWNLDREVTPALGAVRAFYHGDSVVLLSHPFDGRASAYAGREATRLWGPEPPGDLAVPNFTPEPRPAFSDGLMLAASHNGPQVVDVLTGERRWTGDPGWTVVGVHGDTAVVVGEDSPRSTAVRGIHMGSGDQRWSYVIDGRTGDLASGVAVVAGEVVFTEQAHDESGQIRSRLVVLDAASGDTRWRSAKRVSLDDVLGVGPGWVVTESGWPSSGEMDDPHELSLYVHP
ncbi:MAG: PQQ-binding-like beta-propeller repeat protein, partial [Acidimicrobiales bacterium]